jgi:hypothetical protein
MKTGMNTKNALKSSTAMFGVKAASMFGSDVDTLEEKQNVGSHTSPAQRLDTADTFGAIKRKTGSNNKAKDIEHGK